MARPKKVKDAAKEELSVPEPVLDIVIPKQIAKLSVDLGREDLNNIAKKINELIDLFYEKRI